MKKLAIILTFIISGIAAYPQLATSYFMTNLRQSIYTNPARMQDCGFSFSFPALNINSSTYLSTLNLNNIFSADNSGKFYVDFDKLAANSADFNYLYNTQQFSLFSFGIRFGFPLYIHFDQSLRTSFYMNYPQGLVNFLAQGLSPSNPTFSLTDLNFSTMAYSQTALTVGFKLTKDLTVGATIKKLTGLATIYTRNINFELSVDTANNLNYPMTISTAYDLFYSGPVYFSYQDSLVLDTTAGVLAMNGPDIQSIKSLLAPKNHGWALDLGFVYAPIKYIELSGSIVDLGYIKWKTNAKEISHRTTSFTFDGVDVINDTNATTKLLDTLKTLINPTVADNEFSTGLNTRIYLGVALKPVDYLSLGFAYQTVKLQPKNWMSIYHFSAAFNFAYGWSLTGTYSIYPHSYNNFGLGVALKLGFMQLYFLTDNLALPNFGISYFTNRTTPPDQNSATLWLKKTQLINFHFGLNFNFGCKDRLDYGLLD